MFYNNIFARNKNIHFREARTETDNSYTPLDLHADLPFDKSHSKDTTKTPTHKHRTTVTCIILTRITSNSRSTDAILLAKLQDLWSKFRAMMSTLRIMTNTFCQSRVNRMKWSAWHDAAPSAVARLRRNVSWRTISQHEANLTDDDSPRYTYRNIPANVLETKDHIPVMYRHWRLLQTISVFLFFCCSTWVMASLL